MMVFIAAPFTKLIDPITKVVDSTNAEIILRVIDAFNDKGWVVGNAHVREAWGASLMSPTDALTDDLQLIDKSSLVFAILGDPVSPGVQLEIGYAIAKKKQIAVLFKKNQTKPYLTAGLPSVSFAALHEYLVPADIYNLAKLYASRQSQ